MLFQIENDEKAKQVRRTGIASEAEEAAGWYANRKSHDKELAAAVKDGEAQVLPGRSCGTLSTSPKPKRPQT